MQEGVKTPRKRENAPASSVSFVFRGVQYWVVSRALEAVEIPSQLTRAEAEVFALLQAGLSCEQIAVRRSRSRHTVAKQVASILRKLNVTSQRALKSIR